MADPAWAALRDDELLAVRIRDLGVRIADSELQPRVDALYAELEGRGLRLRPPCYLGDEWFSPSGVPQIAIPFYLAHPRLKQLELHQMLDVEGGTPEWCAKLLRHECGHAIDHAYRFSSRRKWREVFGSPAVDYDPDTYRPRPYSRGFVRHLPNWYAQAHPDEDFAETFAVWLATPEPEWRARYQGWKALDKLEYVDTLMREARAKAPIVRGGRRRAEASKLTSTLGRYYAVRRRLGAQDYPDVYDPDLRRIFAASSSGHGTAAAFMRKRRETIVSSVVLWTGQRKYVVDELTRKLVERCAQLSLHAKEDGVALALDIGAYLASLVTNHLHTGRFKRSV
ncbi:MAG TPA: putative zinc-binding metallopeptidase [Polyangiaceae bacterium]|nr:putative zinc-binding metallopeptidase [Polyangiaceae bacterium]